MVQLPQTVNPSLGERTRNCFVDLTTRVLPDGPHNRAYQSRQGSLPLMEGPDAREDVARNMYVFIQHQP